MKRDRSALLEREPAPQTAPRAPFAAEPAVSTAELAECTCPDFCERDHANE
ncbi:MAG: hypothetical protein ABSB24_18395 [Gaiellaceae bacterium]|jgi:hypothetical protein